MTFPSLRFRLAVLGVFGFLLALFVLWFFLSGSFSRTQQTVLDRFEKIALSSGITVKDVYLQGRVRVTNDEIMDLLKPYEGKSFFQIPLDQLHAQILELPWVKSATVFRQFPSALYISIVEREPIALWQTENGYFPVDKEGAMIDSRDISFSYLPLIVGEDAPLHYYALFQILSTEPLIQQRLKGAVFSGKRRWTLFLDDLKNGLVIHLPEKDVKEAFARLAKMDREKHILKNDVDVIDMRVPGKLILKPKVVLPKERRL